MKKILALLAALCLLAACGFAEETEYAELPEGLQYKQVMFLTVDDKTETLNEIPAVGVFEEGGDDSVMLMSVRTFYDLLNTLYGTAVPEISVSEDSLTIARDNGSGVMLLRDGNQIYYLDVDLFEASSGSTNAGDVVSMPAYQTDDDGYVKTDEDGNPLIYLIKHKEGDVSYYRSGATVGTSLDDYDIPVYWSDYDAYLPLAVLNNVLRGGVNCSLIYLDGIVYDLDNGKPDNTYTDDKGYTMADVYYDTQIGDRPEGLTKLTYNLLCLELDLRYGLSVEHGIGDNFDDFLDTVGLKDRMLQQDGQSFYNALYELTMAYFADFHSGMNRPSPYAGLDYTYRSPSKPASTQEMYDAETRFALARYQAGLTQIVPGTEDDPELMIVKNYQEVGDTAYITFDAFDLVDVDYYSEEFQQNITDYIGKDTFALVIYANQQINRKNSPVKKVVIDLSNNGGGVVDTAVYLVSWMLGDCKYSATNPTTGANYTVVYQADVDLDGKITDADHLDDSKLELYCLTSMNSFSCGNLVPCLFKQSGRVTILGQTSGGGACVVKSSMAADGTLFQYSGSKRLCTVKNGSFYSVDEGVTPDFVISKPKHFYDRKWLNNFIKQLP